MENSGIKTFTRKSNRSIKACFWLSVMPLFLIFFVLGEACFIYSCYRNGDFSRLPFFTIGTSILIFTLSYFYARLDSGSLVDKVTLDYDNRVATFRCNRPFGSSYNISIPFDNLYCHSDTTRSQLPHSRGGKSCIRISENNQKKLTWTMEHLGWSKEDSKQLESDLFSIPHNLDWVKGL